MNAKTQELIDQIVNDKRELQMKMLWETDSSAMATLSAFLFAGAGRKADIARYVECKKYFKKHVGVFSEMRGISEVIVITKMCLSDDYEEYLAGVTEVYKKLRHIHKLTASPYMVLTAINIYEAGGLVKADENIEKLEAVYKEMKGDHFWLTGDEDRPFISVLVSRNINFDAIASEISACYEASKKMSFSKEAMHTASQVMALSGRDIESKVEDLRATMEALKKYKINGMKYEMMPMAATLGLIDGNPEDKVAQIKEIYDYFKKQKGFKWYLGNTRRTQYSMLVYAIENLDSNMPALNSAISTALTTIIIEAIVMLIIITSAVHTVNSSSSSSN